MTLNLAAIQASLNKTFLDPESELSDLIARSNPMLAAVTKRSVSTDRIWLRHKAASAHAPGVIADGADLTVGSVGSTYAGGVLDWVTYKAEFNLPKRLLAQVVENPGLLGNLFLGEVQDAAKDMADLIAGDLFSDGTRVGGQLSGLGAIMATTGTYAGINRGLAANAYWRGLAVDAGDAAVSTTLFYQASDAYFERNKQQLFTPANGVVGFTANRILTNYKEMFEQIDFGSLATAHFVNQSNASGTFGRSSVGFLGAPLIPDASVPILAGPPEVSSIYLVNPSEVFLANLVPNLDPEVQMTHTIDPSKAAATDGLRVEVEILGNTGENVKGYVKTYCQLVAPKPNKAGVVISNVLTA